MNIYLAEDHTIVAQGLSLLISQLREVKSVQTFPNGKDLFEVCRNNLPDVVFLDISMPEWNGIFTLEKLQEHLPELRCIMLSMHNEKELINECIRKGASGYLNKDCTKEEFFEAINSTEIPYFSKRVLKELSGYGTEKESIDFPKVNLTNKETEILELICDGMTSKEIAAKLYLSQRTVETHKANIMQKFEVNSVGKLISIVLKNKLV